MLSRSTLGALAGAEQVTAPASAAEYRETRTFLEALARWTRRPAEWARIPPAATRAPLVLGGVTGEPDRAVHVPPRFPPLGAPPRGVALSVLTGAAVPDSTRGGTRAAELPGWAARAGLRALAGNLPALDHRAPAATRAALLDSLADLLEAGAFNLILTNARATALVDSSHWSRWDRDATRATWEQIADRLDATSVRWIPLVAVQDYAADSGYGCPLDPRLWENVLTPAVRALVRLAAAHTDVIPAIGIDLTGTGWARTSYCDVAWQTGLADLASDSGFSRDRVGRLATLPQTERYDSLSAAGLLPRYEGVLERAITRRATALRAEARRSRPDLLFGVVTDQVPADWVTRGLVAGLSGPEAPVMVFGPDDGLSHSIPQALRVVRLDPGRFAHIDTSLAHRVFREREGFWLAPAELLLGRAAPDLIHQLRRFAKDR